MNFLHCIFFSLLDKDNSHAVRGYRKINKHIEANPQWLLLKILGGSGAHFVSCFEMFEQEKHKTTSLKKGIFLTSAIQAYDRLVARNDKAQVATSLLFLRTFCFEIGVLIEQWHLIYMMLNALKHAKPFICKRSCYACNLNPGTRVPFPEWCKN